MRSALRRSPRAAALLAAVALLAAAVGQAAAADGPDSGKEGQSRRAATSSIDPASYRSTSGRHKVVLRDVGQRQLLARQPARAVADYDSYSVAEVGDAALAALGPDVEVRDDLNLIMLNAGAIDTTAPEAASLQADSAGAFEGRRMRLVQFAAPVRPEWYDALAQTGVQIVAAIPQDAYLVYGDQAQLEGLAKLAGDSAFIQYEGPYRDAYRIFPTLADDREQLVAVQLVDDPAANAGTLALLDTLKRGPARVERALGYTNVVATVSAGALAQLAGRPDVISVTPYTTPVKDDERQDQIVAGNISGAGPTGPGYLAWLASQGFTQAQFDSSGFVVDVTDSGIDNGTTSPNHFALRAGGTAGGASRVVYNRLEGTPNAGSTIAGADGHGTINAHIVAGYVPTSAAAFPHADGAGYRYGLGVAPFVRVGSSVIFDTELWTSPSYPNLQSRAYRDGARISSNSWGADVNGAYTIDSQIFDALVRDAQPAGSAVPAAGNQEMVLVFAAGNKGSGAGTMASPGTAKNVITVGASENVQSFGVSDGCGTGDSGADSLNDMGGFSSRGPTADGRVKPDIVAPGTHITGGVWQTASPGANGAADPAFTASGVCGISGGVKFYPSGQQWYTTSTGTSHSTPAVAGGAALVRQYFINRGLPPPSPAMTKAYLVSGASYMTGVGTSALPSNSQGMGLMQLGPLFASTQRILHDQRAAETFTASGQQRRLTATVTDASRPLRVTLAWTDAPGSTSGAAYLNDLDLRVVVGGVTYRGNVFSGGTSVSGGSADRRNNMESVFLPAGLPVGTSVAIIVDAAAIVADGVPNSGGSLDQDFALVGSNLSEVTTPAPAIAGLRLVGETMEPANGAPEPGERMTYELTISNEGTGPTTNLTAALQSSASVTDVTPAQSYGAIAPGGSVTRAFSFTVGSGVTCGGTITLSWTIADGATSYATYSVAVRVGVQPLGATLSGASSAALSIPAGAPGTTSGAASIYPSTITIAGSGTVDSVTVTLSGLSHAYPDDLQALLVGPGGQSAVLMANAGGGNSIAGATLTFSPSAGTSLPDDGQILSSTYLPTAFGTLSLPAPAPSGPYGSLAGFAGSSPAGAWSLYIFDDGTGDTGSLAGWGLSVATRGDYVCGAPVLQVWPDSITTSKRGTARSFSVALSAKPSADVTVALGGNPAEGSLSAASLTFTPANWFTPQTVTVTGVNDGAPGDAAYQIGVSAASADAAYSGKTASVSVLNVEQFRLRLPIVVKP